jgi:hypothetical protein
MKRKIQLDSPALISALETLTVTISNDSDLQKWFRTLETLSYNLRINAILQITTEMRHGDEDPDLIQAIAFLSEPELYQAVKESLDDLE